MKELLNFLHPYFLLNNETYNIKTCLHLAKERKEEIADIKDNSSPCCNCWLVWSHITRIDGHMNCTNVGFFSQYKEEHCISHGVERCLTVCAWERRVYSREASALWLSVTILKWDDVNGNVISRAEAVVCYAPSTVPEHAPSTHHHILCCHGVPADMVQLLHRHFSEFVQCLKEQFGQKCNSHISPLHSECSRPTKTFLPYK